MEREVRYCTTEDGVRIAYCVEGDGTPLVVCAEFAESFSLLHLFPPRETFMRRLGEGRTLVRYDARGCGLSQRDVTDLGGPALRADLGAVIRATGFAKFDLFAATDAGIAALGYVADCGPAPQNLILYGTFVRAADVFREDVIKAFVPLCRANWELAATVFAGGGMDSAILGFVEIVKQSTSGETMARYSEANANADASQSLREVRCPTLVVHRINDPFVPIALAQELAAELPNARLVALPGDVHRAEGGDAARVLATIDEFLGTPRDPDGDQRVSGSLDAGRQSAFRTILFTDVVQNTTLLAEIGDDAWRAVMREHEEIVRAALKDHGGTEISTSGDGFFASFASATRAVGCAVEMQRALAARNASATHPVEVRIGLNAGEPIEDGKDLVGTAVTLAARIMAHATANQILTSDVVRQLVAGKNFSFADAGDFIPKGFPDPVRLHELRWRD